MTYIPKADFQARRFLHFARLGQGLREPMAGGKPFFGFLGIHWGQFPEIWQITGVNHTASRTEAYMLVADGQLASGLSGMTCVAPAEAILEAVNHASIQKVIAYYEENLKTVFFHSSEW